MQRAEKEAATRPDAAGQVANTRNHQERYAGSSRRSSEIFADQIGLLLWRLQGPITQKQHRAGYQLLEALLSQWYAGGAQ